MNMLRTGRFIARLEDLMAVLSLFPLTRVLLLITFLAPCVFANEVTFKVLPGKLDVTSLKEFGRSPVAERYKNLKKVGGLKVIFIDATNPELPASDDYRAENNEEEKLAARFYGKPELLRLMQGSKTNFRGGFIPAYHLPPAAGLAERPLNNVNLIVLPQNGAERDQLIYLLASHLVWQVKSPKPENLDGKSVSRVVKLAAEARKSVTAYQELDLKSVSETDYLSRLVAVLHDSLAQAREVDGFAIDLGMLLVDHSVDLGLDANMVNIQQTRVAQALKNLQTVVNATLKTEERQRHGNPQLNADKLPYRGQIQYAQWHESAHFLRGQMDSLIRWVEQRANRPDDELKPLAMLLVG
jgi:hypothetical protein